MSAATNYAAAQLVGALRSTIALVQEMCTAEGDARTLLNFVVSDGRSVVASRFAGGGLDPASLYYASGSGWEPLDASSQCGEYHMALSDRRAHAHIVASEPLTADPSDWVEIPRNHFVVIEQASLLVQPI